MPTWLVAAGTHVQSGFEEALAQAVITRVAVDQTMYLAVTDHADAVTRWVDVSSGSMEVGAPQWHLPEGRIALSVNDTSASVAPQVLAVAQASGASTQGMLGPLGLQADLATFASATLGDQMFYIAAQADGAGLTSFAANADGTLGAATPRDDNNSSYLQNLSDLAVIETSAGTFVATGSASEHGVSVFRLAESGTLNPVDALGQPDSVPVQAISALEAINVGGRDYLIAAASGSSSLTVFEMSQDGGLSVADHVFDALPTRFAGVSQLATVEVDGQAFVITSGQDDGLSLFQLTTEGRLVHHQSLADQTNLSLDAVSGLGAVATDTGFAVLTSSATEAGLGLFRVEFDAGEVIAQASGSVMGTAGADLLSLTGAGAGSIEGGAGHDLISDGAGQDSLTGGTGHDTFLLRLDGQRDVITDIQPGQDRLDLSLWPFLYSVDQIDIQSTSTGAILTFGTEELELQSWNGNSLNSSAIAQLLVFGPGRADVSVGALQQADAPPDPDPFPDTVPGPDPLPAPPPPEPGDEPGIAPDPQPGPTPQPNPDPGPAPDPNPTPNPLPAPVPTGEVIEGGAGDDLLEGTTGGDVIGGREGNDTLRGQGGNDTLAGAGGEDRVLGGAGRDSLGGGTGNDSLEGGDGNDTLGGGQGNDTLLGGDDNDAISGGAGDDLIEGGAGNDALAGSFGDDVVKGGDGNDDLGGGTGRDRLTGGAGDDSLGGGEGDDTVKGGEGADFLAGGGRNDLLVGDAGADRLNGGAGDDTLTGGAGADTFIFNTLSAGEADVITDFENGVDVLRLNGVPGQGQAARFDQLQISGAGNNTQVEWDGHVILLEGIALGSFGPEDVILT